MDVPGVGRAEAVAPRDGRDRRRVPLDERARASSSPRDAEARRSAGAGRRAARRSFVGLRSGELGRSRDCHETVEDSIGTSHGRTDWPVAQAFHESLHQEPSRALGAGQSNVRSRSLPAEWSLVVKSSTLSSVPVLSRWRERPHRSRRAAPRFCPPSPCTTPPRRSGNLGVQHREPHHVGIPRRQGCSPGECRRGSTTGPA